MSKRLDGQVAIVTGAGRGIGQAIARELAATGANVVINYGNSREAAEALGKEVESAHGIKVLVVKADVTDYEQVREMVRQTIDIFGQVDILVNNAGITRDKTLRNMSREQWDEGHLHQPGQRLQLYQACPSLYAGTQAWQDR